MLVSYRTGGMFRRLMTAFMAASACSEVWEGVCGVGALVVCPGSSHHEGGGPMKGRLILVALFALVRHGSYRQEEVVGC